MSWQVAADTQALNQSSLQPTKDVAGSNQMSVSPLLVGAGTVLLIDETNTTNTDELVLTDVGMQSMRALQSVVSTQTLRVDCGYSVVSIPMELCCVVLSAGWQSCIAQQCELVELQLNSTGARIVQCPQVACGASDGLCALREWWASCRLLDVGMDPLMQVEAESDFLQLRQAQEEGATVADFHRWLTIARLLAVSRGENSISADCWHEMRRIEAARVARTFNPLHS